MASKYLTTILKLSMILIFTGWVSLWLLKPTQLWTKAWKRAEGAAASTVFGYNGLDFVVYTIPIIALSMIGFIYLELKPKEPRHRQVKSPVKTLSNPLVINSYFGIFSAIEILSVLLFILVLVWTLYTRISHDFSKITPGKNLKLNMWQYKFSRVSIRLGSLAEVCLAFLLFPILRRLAIFQFLGIQFEASVRYHVWLGTTTMFLATLHGAGTLFIWGLKNHLNEEIWKWQKTGRIYLAGEISLVAGLVIWITSLPVIRRKYFEAFYYTHHLYIVFIVFFLFHAGDRHFYMVFPGVFLFAIDKLLRIIQSRPRTCIVSARVFPCNAIELVLPKDQRLRYTPTSVIFMKIPSISRLQWHSFSVSSSSSVDDDTMTVIIKCGGDWTNSLFDMIQTKLCSDTGQMKCIPVAIEGPYGPASLDFLRYDNLVLVAGGIGITPFLSILQHTYAQSSGIRSFPGQIQLIYVVKKSQDLCLLDTILPLLVSEHRHLKLKVFVTQEQSGATIRELANEFSQVKTIHFDSTPSSYPIQKLESSVWMAAIIGFSSIMFLVLLVCFNSAFLHPAKTAKKPKNPDKMEDKQKNPSSEVDFFLLCSFGISVFCGVCVALILRWKNIKKEHPLTSRKNIKDIKTSMVETGLALEEHEIHYGGRPDFRGIFSQYTKKTGVSDVGVLVCGPETMKESVASFCKMSSHGVRTGDDTKKPCFGFHSLNFNL